VGASFAVLDIVFWRRSAGSPPHQCSQSSVSGADVQDLDSPLLGGVGSCAVLWFQLPIESLQELRVRIIIEVESILDEETPRETRVDILDKSRRVCKVAR
jgi:hypothetical protein